MQMLAGLKWFSLANTPLEELVLDTTFRCGQAFRWRYVVKEAPESSYWSGVIGEKVYALKQNKNNVEFAIIHPEHTKEEEEGTADLKKYFYLDHSLSSLFSKWSKDKNFKERQERFKGLRLLRQDPVECVFSFICSQNNNIERIGKMIDSFCLNYGKLICEYDNEKYFSFPTIEAIAKIEEDELREMKFGYRAKYIPRAAQQIIEKGGISWLTKLKSLPKKEVQSELVDLMGVGKKVADCIALFSLEKLDVIPVDTHVWQIAQEYMPKLKRARLNEQIYDEIGEFFQKRFGDQCGWAHTILFAAELNTFKMEIKEETKVVETSIVIKDEDEEGALKEVKIKKVKVIKKTTKRRVPTVEPTIETSADPLPKRTRSSRK